MTPHPTPHSTRRFALALVPLLAVAACGGGGGGGGGKDLKVTGTVDASGSGDAQSATVDMTDELTFQPNEVKAKVGTLALTAKNVGQIPHNLVFNDAALGKTDTIDGKASATLKVRLDKAGTYRFTCTFHSGMDGQVVVTG